MNYKILILIALVASVLLSGCLENKTLHQYRILSLTNEQGSLYITYMADNDTTIYEKTVTIRQDWGIFYSNETKIIDNPERKFGQSDLLIYWDGKEIK